MRILVCGSNYGRYYFDALRSGEHEVVGLLARGSERSNHLAEREGVPLWCTVDELPADIDLACAAMSSKANHVVLELIEHGLHVVCEHPQGADFVHRALDLATASGLVFHLNGHFADLPAQQRWIEGARTLIAQGGSCQLEICVSDRAFFAALDTLGRGLGGIDIEDAEIVDRSPGWFWIRARIAGLPATIRIQTLGGADSSVLEDGSPDYLVDCRLTLITDAGSLSLLGITGPVVWLENPNRISGPDEQFWTVRSEELSARAFYEQRMAANRQAVEELIAEVEGGPRQVGQLQSYLRDLAASWDRLTDLIGDKDR